MSTTLRFGRRAIHSKKILLTRNVLRHLSSNQENFHGVASSLGLDTVNQGIFNGQWLATLSSSPCRSSLINPSTGKNVPYSIEYGTTHDVNRIILSMDEAKKVWAEVPAPARGELVRKIGEKLRLKKKDLAILISTGKLFFLAFENEKDICYTIRWEDDRYMLT